MRFRWLVLTFLLVAFRALGSEEVFQSGPQAGALLPGSFAPFNINGKKAAGRHHCLVCEHSLNPVLMVLAREQAEGKDQVLNSLLKQLDEAVERHQEAFLGSFVVFLSPDAQSSATNPKEEDAGKLVEEANAREALGNRLKMRADNLKNVVLAFFPPEGPKGYKVHEKAELTVVFYQRYEVLANFAFQEGQCREKDVAAIIKKIDDTLAKGKKTPKKSEKKSQPRL